LYEPGAKTCYLIGGIHKKIIDPHTFVSNLENNVTRPTDIETLSYQLSDAYPIGDKTILPVSMKSACAYLPVYWLEQAVQQRSLQKRFCLQYCFKVWGVKVCPGICIG